MRITQNTLLVLIHSLFALLISGCSHLASGSGIPPAVPPLPQSTPDLIAIEPGLFAGTHFYLEDDPQRSRIEQELDRLPDLEDGADESQIQAYWARLTSLFAEDYLSPQMVVDRWRIASYGSPDVEDARLQFKENFHVEIILDASGSMNGKIGEHTKMELAKEAIKEFAASLPEGANVSLRVYGHLGSNADHHKQLSCASSELVYPFQPYDEAALDAALSRFEPTGWTPIAGSLRLAKQDMAAFDTETHTNIIYLVSDGIETCDGDPVQVARELAESDFMPLLNVIGFDVNAEGQKQLKEIAKASEGLYANVTNKEQFRQELERAREIAEKWELWKQDALAEIDEVWVDRAKWIDLYKRDWYDKNWRESLNLGAAIDYLAASGKIGNDTRTYFARQRESREMFVAQSQQELVDYLVQLTKTSYEEMKQEIEAKYSGN